MWSVPPVSATKREAEGVSMGVVSAKVEERTEATAGGRIMLEGSNNSRVPTHKDM